MEYSEDHIALAAEYALGTLEAEERTQVEALMALDAEYAAVVQAWEFRLGVLNQMVGSVEPNPDLWDKIRTAIGPAAEPQAPLVLPEEPPSVEAQPVAPEAANDEMLIAPAVPVAAAAPAPTEADIAAVTRLSDRVRAYRSLAVAMTAIAAALLAIIGVQVVSPGLLPGLGGKPPAQVAEVKPPPTPAPVATAAPAPSAQYVALLQGAAGGPAFILTVDEATKNFTVRKVGAPPIDPSKNYELWLISDKLQGQPRSLGVIGTTDFVTKSTLASFDSDVVNNAVYAVTVEQAGGSPDGKPTSAVAFRGKLIETVPPASPAQNR
jgi:anti-sigma-K factor RskA